MRFFSAPGGREKSQLLKHLSNRVWIDQSFEKLEVLISLMFFLAMYLVGKTSSRYRRINFLPKT